MSIFLKINEYKLDSLLFLYSGGCIPGINISSDLNMSI